MRRLYYRTVPLILIVIGLAACSTPQVTGVVAVDIPGGDRQMPLDATMVLGANVTAGNGVSTAVTWASSAASVASIDAQGVLTAVSAGETTITATSTADSSKSASIQVTVVVDAAAARSFDATYVAPDPTAPPVLGASFAVADAGFGPTSFTEVVPGLFLGPVAPVGPDGSVSVTLPAPADVPATVLADVTGLFPALESAVDCELTASAPSTKVTPFIFELFTVPGVVLSSFGGLMPAVLSDSESNPYSIPEEELDLLTLYTYLYADGPSTVVSSGTDCSTTGIAAPVAFDLELVEGWNQVTIELQFDDAHLPELMTVTNGEATELFIHPAIF